MKQSNFRKKMSQRIKKLNFILLLPMKKVIITIICFFTLTIIIGLTIFSQRGLIHMMQLQEELQELKDYNDRLQNNNKSLKQEIRLLKNNPHYMEELARKELGLVKKGEIVYNFKKSEMINN